MWEQHNEKAHEANVVNVVQFDAHNNSSKKVGVEACWRSRANPWNDNSLCLVVADTRIKWNWRDPIWTASLEWKSQLVILKGKKFLEMLNCEFAIV